MIIASHLSDVQHLIDAENDVRAEINERLNFAKHLLFKYEDTREEVLAEQEWELFIKDRKETLTKLLAKLPNTQQGEEFPNSLMGMIEFYGLDKKV